MFKKGSTLPKTTENKTFYAKKRSSGAFFAKYNIFFLKKSKPKVKEKMLKVAETRRMP